MLTRLNFAGCLLVGTGLLLNACALEVETDLDALASDPDSTVPKIGNGARVHAGDDGGNTVVELLITGADERRSRCTGQMVTNEFVVTAAHCVESVPVETDIEINYTLTSGAKISVFRGDTRNIFIHPDYRPEYDDSRVAFADIAVIQLRGTATTCEYGAWCQTLPDTGPAHANLAYSAARQPDSYTLFAYGREGASAKGGYLNRGDGLQRVSMLEGDDTGLPGLRIDARFERADGRTCAGDSGAPWQFRVGEFWLAAGVHSTGTDCDDNTGSMYATAWEGNVPWVALIIGFTAHNATSCVRHEVDGVAFMHCDAGGVYDGWNLGDD